MIGRRKSNWAECPRCFEEWWLFADAPPRVIGTAPGEEGGCRVCRSRVWRWLAPRFNRIGGRR